MSSRTRYIANETIISVAINGALSVAFVFLVFHGAQKIEVVGRSGMITDMAPQTFMVTLMSCLVPALLTRSRHAAGKLAWHEKTATTAVSEILLRALVGAFLATCLVVALSEVTFPRMFPAGLGFGSFLVGKAIFGMALAAIVTPWATAIVLR